MPDYTFTGAYPRVLSGLSQGVNASLTPVHGVPPVFGATVEAAPGDRVRTDEPYVHPELEEAAAPAPAEPPVVPIQLVAADPAPAPVDPAHDAMTAEGAPAPAAPTA